MPGARLPIAAIEDVMPAEPEALRALAWAARDRVLAIAPELDDVVAYHAQLRAATLYPSCSTSRPAGPRRAQAPDGDAPAQAGGRVACSGEVGPFEGGGMDGRTCERA
jgi:hypothetical protein